MWPPGRTVRGHYVGRPAGTDAFFTAYRSRWVRYGRGIPRVAEAPRSVANTDCSDTGGRKVADWLARDVSELSAGNVRTPREPAGRGLVGGSTGGVRGEAAAAVPEGVPGWCGPGSGPADRGSRGAAGCGAAWARQPRCGWSGRCEHRRQAVHGHLRAGPGQPAAAVGGVRPSCGGQRVRAKILVRPADGHNSPIWGRDVPRGAGLAEDRTVRALPQTAGSQRENAPQRRVGRTGRTGSASTLLPMKLRWRGSSASGMARSRSGKRVKSRSRAIVASRRASGAPTQ